jgi:enediyne biosynthesis protein E5
LTEKLVGVGDWVLPGVIICTGSFLNWRFTKRLPLIAASLSCFVAQGPAAALAFGARLESASLPMTGAAFILYFL